MLRAAGPHGCLRRGAERAGMTAMGHEERFPSPSLSGRCRLGEATFAGMGGKEEDAP